MSQMHQIRFPASVCLSVCPSVRPSVRLLDGVRHKVHESEEGIWRVGSKMSRND